MEYWQRQKEQTKINIFIFLKFFNYGNPCFSYYLGKFMLQSTCRAIPRWWKPLLIHDNLLLCKGVEKGGSHDKTRNTCNSKKCPSRHRTFNTYYYKFIVGIVQEVERPLPTLLL